jgi:hypothetical protein
VIDGLKTFNPKQIEVRMYPDKQRLSFHLWMSERAQNTDRPVGIIAIVDVEANIEEAGFHICAPVYKQMHNIAEAINERSQ